MATALGVDVGGPRKGLDLVLMDETRTVLQTARRVSTVTLGNLIREWQPDCIGIDSPPMWANGCERQTETEMRRLGLQFYQTPWLPEKQTNAFYVWMTHGFAAFETARACGYPLYDGGFSVQQTAFETFPSAITAVLTGVARPPDVRKGAWRRRVLAEQRVEVTSLRGPDQVDAALAALAGVLALEGRFCWKGAPAEGVMVLPCLPEDLQPTYRTLRLPRGRAAPLLIG